MSKPKRKPAVDEEIYFDDSLSTEMLAAAAMCEQMEEAKKRKAESSQEKDTADPPIDPSFQEVYNNI